MQKMEAQRQRVREMSQRASERTDRLLPVTVAAAPPAFPHPVDTLEHVDRAHFVADSDLHIPLPANGTTPTSPTAGKAVRPGVAHRTPWWTPVHHAHDTVHVVLLVPATRWYTAAVATLRSIIFERSSAVHVHVIVDPVGAQYLRNVFPLTGRTRSGANFTVATCVVITYMDLTAVLRASVDPFLSSRGLSALNVEEAAQMLPLYVPW
jgi:hypothetical protein